MYARVVRFTDVDPEHIERRIPERAEEGPPEGVEASGMQILHDAEQGTAVVIQLFETEEAMRASESVLSGMDPADTPGTRASVDRCEIKAELKL